jgi:hypothetical protein
MDRYAYKPINWPRLIVLAGPAVRAELDIPVRLVLDDFTTSVGMRSARLRVRRVAVPLAMGMDTSPTGKQNLPVAGMRGHPNYEIWDTTRASGHLWGPCVSRC